MSRFVKLKTKNEVVTINADRIDFYRETEGYVLVYINDAVFQTEMTLQEFEKLIIGSPILKG